MYVHNIKYINQTEIPENILNREKIILNLTFTEMLETNKIKL